MPVDESTYRLYQIIDSGNYISQGFGCMRYTKNAARLIADKALFYGLDAKVLPYGKKYGDCQDYSVWINTTDIGCRILDYKPNIPIKNWIKLCWKRGVNPRVYNPYLPYDIEKKLGINYFGNDVGER